MYYEIKQKGECDCYEADDTQKQIIHKHNIFLYNYYHFIEL
ncbi:hypothetical protein MTBBW1_2320016 [Desulfamplus magnetovallimortis]|uniref:Uncharacterized protein n=1 Tax=Desulfamplus magnetovallimortis TaxID=1246637 RepID=A0A1W1HDP9_9BACT|nr:hypothetical protein MTBBW1_2320016 [Desulfamplus magnetovallimortis]